MREWHLCCPLWGYMNKMKSRLPKSFSKRIIKVWFGAVLIPLLVIEIFILIQTFRSNTEKTRAEIQNSLSKTSEAMTTLMDSMNSISWLLQADSTVGKDLHLYFDEKDVLARAELITYLRDQIAHYEIANPIIANITYLYIPKGETTPIKINATSLTNGEMPDEADFLCQWQDMNFYGPHLTKSKVAEYSCISLLREYKGEKFRGDIYIYLESGYKYLQKVIPDSVLGMNTLFLIESQDGQIMYRSDEESADQKMGGHDTIKWEMYQSFENTLPGDWKIHLLVSKTEYNKVIYGMVLNISLMTIGVVIICLLMSVLEWQSIYRPFTKFEKQIRQITASEHVETKIEEMNIQEFDENFALLNKLKQNILLLLNRVQEEEKKRVEVEMKSVLGKINPHFLYNTLDTLKWYAAGKQDREMVHFITALNRLLLYNMSKERETTLKSELDAVSSYIVLQQMKYDLEFYIDEGSHPEILQADMPRFILQPIVENAILHSGAQIGKIGIEVELLANGKIAILVKNTGNPIDPKKIKDVLVQKKDVSSNGIGLQYVARMLENRFDDNFELKAERTVDGINVVEICIPFESVKIVSENSGSGTSGELR